MCSSMVHQRQAYSHDAYLEPYAPAAIKDNDKFAETPSCQQGHSVSKPPTQYTQVTRGRYNHAKLLQVADTGKGTTCFSKSADPAC